MLSFRRFPLGMFEKKIKKGQPSGYPSLDSSGRIPTYQLGSGNPAGKFLRGDRTWALAEGGSGGGDMYKSTYDPDDDGKIANAQLTSGSDIADAINKKHTNTLDHNGTTQDSVIAGKEPANSNIQAHVTSSHAPSNAQKNSDITKAEIEAKLTGELTSHSHAGGSGDMTKAVYDSNNDGVIEPAQLNLSGKANVTHNHVPSDITGTAVVDNDSRLSDARIPTIHDNTKHSTAFATASDLTTHTGNTSNPHTVTKSQVNLGNCDNTSDANKPISTTTQSALDGKASTTHNQDATTINSGTLDGDRLPALSTTKKGGAPATGTPSGKYLKDDGTWATPASGGGDVVYVPTTADTAINSTTDVTIVTRDINDVQAGDQVIVDAWFTVLNNSTATRVITITLDFDGLFDIEHASGALATSTTLLHPFRVMGVCDIRATNLAYAMVHTQQQLAAGIASGGDTTVAATHLEAKGWGESTSDATGILTIALKVRSANATATQTLRLHHFTIRKVRPT